MYGLVAQNLDMIPADAICGVTIVVPRLPEEQRRANVHRQLLRGILLHRVSGRGKEELEVDCLRN